MNDPSIRLFLRDHYLNHERIFEEKAIKKGKSIVDVLGVDQTYLTGYEIKSKVDSLSRLEKQLDIYRRVCDFVYVVLHEKHMTAFLDIILRLEETRPIYDAVGYIVLNDNFDIIDQKPAMPMPIIINSQFHLLWKEEMIELLEPFEKQWKLRKMNRQALLKLAKIHYSSELKGKICSTLLKRISYEDYMNNRK